MANMMLTADFYKLYQLSDLFSYEDNRQPEATWKLMQFDAINCPRWLVTSSIRAAF